MTSMLATQCFSAAPYDRVCAHAIESSSTLRPNFLSLTPVFCALQPQPLRTLAIPLLRCNQRILFAQHVCLCGPPSRLRLYSTLASFVFFLHVFVRLSVFITHLCFLLSSTLLLYRTCDLKSQTILAVFFAPLRHDGWSGRLSQHSKKTRLTIRIRASFKRLFPDVCSADPSCAHQSNCIFLFPPELQIGRAHV